MCSGGLRGQAGFESALFACLTGDASGKFLLYKQQPHACVYTMYSKDVVAASLLNCLCLIP